MIYLDASCLLKLLLEEPESEAVRQAVGRPLSGSLFQTALRQDRAARRIHCRTLDRLHLAAMEELGLRRLMTNDAAEAAGAAALGFDVVRPGQS